MLVFLVCVGLVIAILQERLWAAMLYNPFLNFLICGVLFFGICYAFSQVLRLYPEIRWVNAFRVADPGLAISARPVLLAPMATMLRDRSGALSLSAPAMRAIMDSIASRLDEARDTGRYLVGLLVFLGLLGTFWGLLDTISAVGRTISAIDMRAADSVTVFDELKRGLSAPLGGMGTAFASALLGLGGSLVLGFLELAGEPCAQPLLQPAGGVAVGHYRSRAQRLRDQRLRQPPALRRHHRHAPRGSGPQRARERHPQAGRRSPPQR